MIVMDNANPALDAHGNLNGRGCCCGTSGVGSGCIDTALCTVYQKMDLGKFLLGSYGLNQF
jgi:hypothetical protein